ncbi:hypothetical protein ZEAMMB73_Zm00001d042147 [Zea mays]|uniref:Uncharacterized protein n=1 Tax=Zea mays TaxID=4577 RepID=A0A1D6N1Q4_MAIZE|nr:hypothetical protein ZEAMMB73_Zm00001d042147 [Zea mays]ONM34649.1 hypothetical protein ZEAMMB73_Zm00001d042147 [Zea mays]
MQFHEHLIAETKVPWTATTLQAPLPVIASKVALTTFRVQKPLNSRNRHKDNGSDAFGNILCPGARMARGSYLCFLRSNVSHLAPKWVFHCSCSSHVQCCRDLRETVLKKGIPLGRKFPHLDPAKDFRSKSAD